ncbi:MAG: beta-ketoacyl-ACP synthase II [Nitrospirota bacterium]|nr:beta-ketoacyl-ACP synthase II [Nitrospirota bacterium]
MNKRVVITGMGLITPLGIGVEETWNGLVAGKSGIGRITHFDPTDFASQIAGEVKGFDPTNYIEAKEVKKMDTFIHFAIAASQMAMDDSGLKITSENADFVGVHVGAGIGGLPAIENNHKTYLERGSRRITPFFIPMVISNLAAGHISIRFGAKGPNISVVTACATGTHSIGDAFRMIQRGDALAMIAGGTESTICPLAVGGFAAMKALSTRNDEPEKASRPFNADRDGFVIAEGAGIVVLEELEHAKARGARIYAEVAGYGLSGDAYHMTAPSEDGDGAARCMKMAIRDSKLAPSDFGYINAHATSTMADAIETRAIKTVFGDHARKLAIGATKSMTGHLLGAAGGVEAIFTALTIDRGIIPPTINQENLDPACDLDYVPNQARKADVSVALSNSFGFGGTNASLVLKKLES